MKSARRECCLCAIWEVSYLKGDIVVPGGFNRASHEIENKLIPLFQALTLPHTGMFDS